MRCAAIVFLQLELNLNIGLKITIKQPSSYTECLQAYVNECIICFMILTHVFYLKKKKTTQKIHMKLNLGPK